MSYKELIRQYAYNIGIQKIGFCTAQVFDDMIPVLEKRKKNKWYTTFEEENISKRVDPSISMEGAKSFIVILESYNVNIKNKSENNLVGNISSYAVGIDYHHTLISKLEQLEKYIKTLKNCKIQKYVDQSPFIDRQVALRAGMGFIGKNTMLINKDFGSRFFIGYLLTDLIIEPDKKEHNYSCLNCTKCVKACPTGAIKGDYSFNASICISYLTQYKGEISSEFKEKMGKQLYGCDICQNACPYNNDLSKNIIVKPIISTKIPIKDILKLSNKEFKKMFGQTAAGWRGKKILQRNAVIALGNTQSIKALPLLESLIDDSRKEIRTEVIWALTRIKHKESLKILYNMLKLEKDPSLLLKIEQSINLLEGGKG